MNSLVYILKQYIKAACENETCFQLFEQWKNSTSIGAWNITVI